MLRTYFYLTQALVCLASVAPTLSTLLEDNGDESSIDEITEFRIIKTENGLVRGKKELTLFDQRAYYSFKGIPYGRAPVGELRFKSPQKAQPWPGTLDAFDFGTECVQPKLVNIEWKGEEDCLFLNVFAPAGTRRDEPLAVIMYLHFGSFCSGTANIAGPDFLIDENVIVVTINYRVGIFGFLSLGTPEYSGNMGLKDQVLALQWVNENIQNFGGDRSRITLFGSSAGSAAASYSMLSPMAKNLFQRAILLSGCALNTWTYTEQNHTAALEKFGEQIFHPVSSKADLIKLLRDVDTELLAKYTFQHPITPPLKRRVSEFLWAPVIEHADAIEPFLQRTPMEILQSDDYSDDKDLLIGHTSDEGYILNFKELLVPSKIDYAAEIEVSLPFKEAKISYVSEAYIEIMKRVRQFYFGDSPGSLNRSEVMRSVSNIFTDIFFAYGVNHFAKIHAEKSSGQTFFYRFSADTGLNTFKLLSTSRMLGLPGATHLDDIFYVFRIHGQMPYFDSVYTRLKENSLERELIRNVTRMMTNFAKFGTPSNKSDMCDFPPVTSEHFNYVDITNEGFVPKVDPGKERVAFWDGILSNYSYLWTPQLRRNSEPLHRLDLHVYGITVAGIVLFVILVTVFQNFMRIATFFVKIAV